MDRRWWLAGMGAAVAGPYFAFDGSLPLRNQLLGPPAVATVETDLHWNGPPGGEPLATPVVPLEEALRANISPQWVVSRWPRVTTTTSELDWSGMRVPLITGNQPGDLVGSLTYYFDTQQKLRRISLEGYTAEERQLVAIAIQNFNLHSENSLSAGLFVARWNREPLSVLVVEYASVVDDLNPQTQRRVAFEFNRPDPGWRLSTAMQARISPKGW